MKVKFIFALIEYLGKSTEFFWDFSKFLYFPPLVDIYRHPLLSNHDGNAKENVTLKMTSKYFKVVRDSFNSFNLSNVAEQSGS